MLPLLKRTTDNLVAVVGEKAASQESFEVLRYNNSIIIIIVCTIISHHREYLHGCILILLYMTVMHGMQGVQQLHPGDDPSHGVWKEDQSSERRV